MEWKREIKKIYWITHPAFPLSTGRKCGYSFKQISVFLETVVLPAIKQAQTEPDAIVVLIKEPLPRDPWAKQKEIKSLRDLKRALKSIEGKNINFIRKCDEVERALASFSSHLLKDRFIMSERLFESDAAKEVFEQLIKRRFKVLQNAELFALGSFREQCAKVFPEAFKREARIRSRIKGLGSYTISAKQRFRGFKGPTRKRLP